MKSRTDGDPAQAGAVPGERQVTRIYAICHIDEETLKYLAG